MSFKSTDSDYLFQRNFFFITSLIVVLLCSVFLGIYVTFVSVPLPIFHIYTFFLYTGEHAFSGKKNKTDRKWVSLITHMVAPTSYMNFFSKLHSLL